MREGDVAIAEVEGSMIGGYDAEDGADDGEETVVNALARLPWR